MRAPGIRPGDRVDRLDLAAPALRRSRVDERQRGVAEPAEQARSASAVSSARGRGERTPRGSIGAARAQRAVPGSRVRITLAASCPKWRSSHQSRARPAVVPSS